MANKDLPAFARPFSWNESQALAEHATDGLTKRELAVLMAMQGLAAGMKVGEDGWDDYAARRIPGAAIELADRTLNALAKDTRTGPRAKP